VNARDVAIDAAEAADLAELVALELLCAPHPWSPPLLRAAVEGAAGESVLVARAAQGAPALLGFCVSRVVAGEAEIHDVAVHPAHRRQGLARMLLETALCAAAGTGASVAHLEVREGNEAAIALYCALGFRVTGRRKGYYTSPAEDALLFSAALPLAPPPTGGGPVAGG
jgi:ribosomal-protein-alanine N-acetyltransferase